MDYLFHQAGQLLSFHDLYEAGDDDDDDSGVDEGFVDQSADNSPIQEQDLLMIGVGDEQEEDDDNFQQVYKLAILCSYSTEGLCPSGSLWCH